MPQVSSKLTLGGLLQNQSVAHNAVVLSNHTPLAWKNM